MQYAEHGLADAGRIFEHRLEHRLQLAGRTADDLKDLGRRCLLLPRLGKLARTCLKLLPELSRVRLELLFRRRLRFLRPAELTHAGRPKLRIRRKHTTPAPPLCETVHAAGSSALHHRDATPWSNSEHFRCCPRTCRLLRDTVDGGEPTLAFVGIERGEDAPMSSMRRREFITLLGGAAAAWPLAAGAQQGDRVARIGMLLGIAENDLEAQARIAAFRKGLRDLGWVEGRNVQIDYRFAAGDANRIKAYVAELVTLAPDVFLANSTPVVAALRQATTSIPIVFAVVNDPVGQGFISSLAHPGGNITGFTLIEFPMVGKVLGVPKAVSPDMVRAALMFNPNTSPYYDVYLRSFEAIPRSIAVEVTATPVRNTAEIEEALPKLGRQPG